MRRRRAESGRNGGDAEEKEEAAADAVAGCNSVGPVTVVRCGRKPGAGKSGCLPPCPLSGEVTKGARGAGGVGVAFDFQDSVNQ